jgi:hypothetical protein
MKARWSSGVLAAVLAVTLSVTGTARPAQAALTDWFNVIINAVQTIASGSGHGGSSSQLDAAKREIINAVESAKQEILNHIDAIASADVQACTESAVTKFAQIDSMPPELLGPFVNGAVDCAALSVAYFNAVQDPAAADNIGKLMGVIHAIAMASFTKYGLSIRDLLTQLIGGYENVVVKLKPTNCTKYRVQEVEVPGFIESWWECFAYNGDFGRSNSAFRGREPDRAQAEDRASGNTSRGIAQSALPQLRAALATAT